MSREEFMKELENLLSDVSEEEKKEALEYYRGYFEDAGEENEERILRELESPEKVAQTIKADLETGKERQEETQEETQQNTSATAGEGNDKTWKILLVVVIAVLTSPIWVGVAGGLLGGALGLAGGLLGIVIAAIAVAGSLYIAGAVISGVGIAQLAVGNVAAGMGLLGGGLVVLALAVLATIGCVWLYGGFLPWLIRTLVSLCKRVFSGKGKAE